MNDVFFVGALAVLVFVLFGWAFRTLPHEGWQILASVPTVEKAAHQWSGVNLTYYGALLASAMVATTGPVGSPLNTSLTASAMMTMLEVSPVSLYVAT